MVNGRKKFKFNRSGKKLRKQVSDLSGGISKTGIKLDVPIDKGVAHPTLSPKFTSRKRGKGELF